MFDPGIKCLNCAAIVLEYELLTCKHKLCTYCVGKAKNENKVKCPIEKCGIITEEQPIRVRVKTVERTTFSEVVQAFLDVQLQYGNELRKKEMECALQMEKLEESVKALRDEEKRQTEDLNAAFQIRAKELEKHYDGLRDYAWSSFRERENQLEKLIHEVKNILIEIRDDIKDMYKTLATTALMQQPTVEKKEMEEVKRKTAEVESQTIELSIPGFEMTITQADELNLKDDIDITAPAPILVAKGKKRGDVSLETLSVIPWTQENQVTVPDRPRCLRVICGQLWQCHNSGIAMYDASLNQLRTIRSGDMGWVHDVVSLPRKEIVMAVYAGLYHMTQNGDKLHEIAKGEFTSVAYHENRVYAVDCENSTVHVFQYNDGWEEIDSFRVEGAEDGLITVSIHKGLLYVCSYYDNQIATYTLTGEFEATWGEYGSGDAGMLNYPYLCDTQMGSVLVADNRNNRLQVLNARREWKVVTMQPPLENPHGAALFHGNLFVNSWDKCSLAMYE